MRDGTVNDCSLRDYPRVARRRRSLIPAAVVDVPVAAVLVSLRQERVDEASAEVLLGCQKLAADLTGTLILCQPGRRRSVTERPCSRS